jgi:hypothetical protein
MQVRWLRRLLIKSLSQSPDRAPLLAACLIITNLNFRALVRSKEFFCANHSVSACTNQTAATFLPVSLLAAASRTLRFFIRSCSFDIRVFDEQGWSIASLFFVTQRSIGSQILAST